MADTEKDEVKSPLSFAQKLQKQTTESQQILDQHRSRLMSLVSARQQLPFDPALMSLASGLLAPTKTGGFGESLGMGMQGYQQETERQFKRQQDEAKMAYELETMAQQQKRDLMGQQMLVEMFEGQMPGGPAMPAAPAGEAPVAIAPAVGEAPVAAAPAVGEAPVAPAAGAPAEVAQPKKPAAADVVKAIPELALPAIPRNAITRMTDEQIALLESFNPAMGKILKEYRTAFRQNRELQIKEVTLAKELQQLQLSREQGARQEREVSAKEQSVKRYAPGVGAIEMPMAFWSALDNAKTFDDVKDAYKKFNVPLNLNYDDQKAPRFMTESELELRKKREEARFSQPPIEVPIPELGSGKFTIDRVTWDDYRRAKSKGGNTLQQFFNDNFPESGIKVKGATLGTVGAPTAVESVEQRDVRTAREKQLVENEAKATIALDETIRGAGRSAESLIQNSDTLLELMNNPAYKGAWGMFSGPGIKNATVQFLKEGLQVGNFNVGLPALESALKKANMTQDQIDASAEAMRIYGELKLQVAKKDLAGQGSVSDAERRLIGDVASGLDSPIKSAMATAELLKYRAQFDKETMGRYNAWRKANPSEAGSLFYDSKEYRQMVKEYDGVMKDLRTKYFPRRSAPASSGRSTSTATPPRGGNNPLAQ
jgi:hypothetical protein